MFADEMHPAAMQEHRVTMVSAAGTCLSSGGRDWLPIMQLA